MVIIEGREYADDAPVAWDVAERVGGFYFARCQWLRLPPPPAVFVADDGSIELDNEQLAIIGRYHELMRDAEDDVIVGECNALDEAGEI